jgi:hypothetical protein
MGADSALKSLPGASGYDFPGLSAGAAALMFGGRDPVLSTQEAAPVLSFARQHL